MPGSRWIETATLNPGQGGNSFRLVLHKLLQWDLWTARDLPLLEVPSPTRETTSEENQAQQQEQAP
jgi:hypothetical protein